MKKILLSPESFNKNLLEQYGLEINVKSGGSYIKPGLGGYIIERHKSRYKIFSLINEKIEFYSAKKFLDTVVETESQLNISLFH